MNGFTFDWENYLTQTQAQISTPEFVISLALTAITAYILKRVYIRFGQALSNRSIFADTFVPMAMTTMIIIVTTMFTMTTIMLNPSAFVGNGK